MASAVVHRGTCPGKLETRCRKRVQYIRPQKQSEPQEKGRCLWFKEIAFSEVMCTRQESEVGRSGTDGFGNPCSRMVSGSEFCGMSGWERRLSWQVPMKRGFLWRAFCKGCSR